jgi:hypothetical protein
MARASSCSPCPARPRTRSWPSSNTTWSASAPDEGEHRVVKVFPQRRPV